MKIRIIVLICAAVMMVACGGNGSSCPKEKGCSKEEKACSKEAGEKACCKAGEKACCKDGGKACCKDGGKACCKACEKACCKDGEKACCKAAGMKKIISAQVSIKPEKVDAFINLTKDLIEKSRAEEGCVSYSLYQDPQDKTKFLFFEEWKNQAAVDFHFDTEHFKKFGDVLNDCASAPAAITIYDSPAEKKV